MTDDEIIRALSERFQAIPLSKEEINAAEAALGLALPPLLRRVYTEVADGGFGAGYGLLSFSNANARERTIVEVRDEHAKAPDWPTCVVPICEWGCAIWSWLDCRSADGPVLTSADGCLRDTGHTLRSWIAAWLGGTDLWAEMFEPGSAVVRINPFTKQPQEFPTVGKPRGKPWP